MSEEKITEMTQSGLEEKKKRLNYLENEKRNEISEQIKYAKSLGDFSENAELDAAKLEDNSNEKEIAILKHEIATAKIITATTYTILDLSEKDAEPETYIIVGASESSVLNHKISNDSPLANALKGSKKGDTVIVKSSEPYKIKVVDIK